MTIACLSGRIGTTIVSFKESRMSKQDSGSYRCRPTAFAARIAARPERGAA